MAIKIPFIADVADFMRGTRNMADELDEVADSLEGLERDSTRAGDEIADAMRDAGKPAEELAREVSDSADKIGDAFRDAGKDADRAGKDMAESLEKPAEGAEDLERKVKDAMGKVTDHARTAGKQTSDATRKGFDDAADSTAEFRDEARQNLGETMSSFRGDIEDIPQILQDVLGGVAPALGGLGTIAAAGAAAAVGVMIAKMQELAEENTEAAQGASDLAAAYIDAGGKIEDLDIGGIISSWGREVQEDQWWTFWANEAGTNFEKTAELAEEAGVRISDAVRAQAGAHEDSHRFMERTAELQAELNEVIQAGTRYDADGVEIKNESARAAQRQWEAIEKLRDGAKANMQTHEEAAAIYEIETDAVRESTEAIEAKEQATRDLYDATSGALEADLKYIETLEETTATIKENGKTIDRNTEAGRENLRALVALRDESLAKAAADAEAGASTEELTALTRAQREAFIKAATAAGYTATEAENLADKWGLVPGVVETNVEAHTAEAERKVQSWLDKRREMFITAKPDLTDVETRIARLNGRTVRLNIKGYHKNGMDFPL